MKYFLSLLFIVLTLGASAQKMPERSEVRAGNKAYAKGNFKEAIKRYEKAREYDSLAFEVVYNYANALQQNEQYEAAEKQYKSIDLESLKDDKERSDVLYNLGNAIFKQHRYEEALENFKQAILLNGDNQDAKFNYAYTNEYVKKQEQDKQNQDQNKDQNQDQDQNKDQNKDQENQDNQDQNKEDNQDNQGDQDKDQDQNKDQDQDQDDKQDQDNQDDQSQNQDDQNKDQDNQDQNGDQEKDQEDNQDQPKDQPQDNGGQAPNGQISPQEQQQMLDAIQAQEDKTQEKVKDGEKIDAVMIPGHKNW